MGVKFSNNAFTTLSSSINAGATSLSVASVSTFPSLGGGDHMYVSLTDEVVKVTAISGTTLTCVATSGAHSAGISVELRMTAELLNDFAEDEEALPLAGGAMTGNITMAGSQTVDGRDLSVDGTKLDGIETSATADQTAAQIKTALENGIDSVHYVDGSIDAEHIAADAVTEAKLNLISTSSVPSLEAKGDGSSQDGYIQLNCSQNSHGIKLKSPPHSANASYTLTFPNDDGAANEVLLTNGSGVLDWTTVGTASIAADAVTGAKIADDAINSEHYTDGSVDHVHLAADAVDGDNIADDSINSEHIAADSIDAEHYAAGSVDTTALGADSVTTAKIADNVTLGGNVTVSGNLTVSGTETTVNTATLAVEDPLVSLATGNNGSDAIDIGVYGLYDTSGSQDLYSGLFRDASDSGKWKLFKDNQAAPTTTVNTSGTGYAVGTLVANLEGAVTGDLTGQAATATKLHTARAFTTSGDVVVTSTNFDGSANFTAAATIQTGAVEHAMLAADCVDGDNIANGSVDSEHIAADSLDSTHYAPGSVDATALAANSVDSSELANGSIDTAHISDDAVTYAKMQHTGTANRVLGAASTGAIGEVQIVVGMMASNSVDTAQIVNGAVGINQMSANSVDSNQYVDGSIDHVHLAGDCVDSDNIADNSINSEHYVDGSIDTAHIADDAVTAAKIGNDAINHGDMIADGVIGTEHYADGSIQNEHIADDAINSEHYHAASIDAEHIANSAVTAAKLVADQRGYITHIGRDAGDYIHFTNTEIDFYCNSAKRMRLEGDGDLQVDGDVVAYSTAVPSDATLKYDISPIDHALDKVAQLTGVTYKYLKDGMESAGLLAQDVEKVMPCAVSERKLPFHKNDGKSYKTLNYDNLHALLIESIKELTAKVEKLEKK